MSAEREEVDHLEQGAHLGAESQQRQQVTGHGAEEERGMGESRESIRARVGWAV